MSDTPYRANNPCPEERMLILKFQKIPERKAETGEDNQRQRKKSKDTKGKGREGQKQY